MGCGGSKEAVATGNTTTASAVGKLLRRKSSVSTGQSHTSSSSGNTGVAVKDVVKDPAAGEAKAEAAEVTSPEKPPAGDSKDGIVVMSLEKPVVEAHKEEVVVVSKDVADDVASAPAAATAAAEQAKEVVAEEDPLPESTMAGEVPEAAAKVEEARDVAPNDAEKKVEKVEQGKPEEEKATSPAPTNEDGESAGQKQNTTESGEAKPVGEQKPAEEASVAAPVLSAEEKSATDVEATAAAAIEAPAK